MPDLLKLTMSLANMLDEKGLLGDVQKIIPQDCQYMFQSWREEVLAQIHKGKEVHEVTVIKRGTTRKGDPMWKCTTNKGIEFYAFYPFQLPGFSLYEPELTQMSDGDTIYWDMHPIRVRLEPDGKFLKPIWIEQRPEGAEPNKKQIAFNVFFVRALFGRGFATIDFETTGLQDDAEIIEIGIVFSDGRPSIRRLVRPQRPIPAEATAIHGITNADVEGCANFELVWAEVQRQIENVSLVAWNAEFEEARLRYELNRIDSPILFPMPNFRCAMKAYDGIEGEYRKLSQALRDLGIPFVGRAHSALDDAQALMDVMRALKARVDDMDARHAKMVMGGSEETNPSDIDGVRGAPFTQSVIGIADQETETDGGR